MSIRSAAAAAIAAEDAAAEAQKRANVERHAQAAVAAVERLIGLTGKCVRALRTSPDEKDSTISAWGESATVKVADGEESIFLLVGVELVWHRDAWGEGSRKEVVGLCLTLTSETADYTYQKAPNGKEWGRCRDYKIKSLADLGKALQAYDDFCTENPAKAAAGAGQR